MKKLAFIIYCATAGLLLASAAATAGDEYDYDYGYRWHDHRNSLVGAWQTVITLRFAADDCATAEIIPPFAPNPFPAFFTFHDGGTMSEWGSRVSPARRSSGHGVWERTSGRNYAYRLQFHSFDELGSLVATMDWHTDLALAKDGQTFEAVSHFERYNLDGTVLNFCATITGERINL
jgi:hypothetical protein